MTKFFADADVLEKRGLAHTSKVEAELVELSRDKDAITRMGVAANVLTPAKALERLGKDKDWGVRKAVGGNRSTPTDTKATLRNDPNVWVREGVR